MTGPLGQQRFSLAVTPARAAYLIKAGSRAGLHRAVCEATTRWGGATEPIVPVRSNGSVDRWWRQVIDILRPDGLVNVDAASDGAAALATDLSLDLTPIDSIDDTGRTMFCANPTTIWDPPASIGNNASLLTTGENGLWEAIAGGDLTPGAEQWCREHGVAFRRPRTADETARAQLFGGTALDRTTDQLTISKATGWWPGVAIVWVTKPNSYRDLLSYWNIRALRDLGPRWSPMMLVADPGIEFWVDFDRQLHQQLRRPVDGAPDVVLCSHSVGDERLTEIAELLGLHRFDARYKPNAIRFPEPPPREPPFTYLLNFDVRHEAVFGRVYGSAAHTIAQIYPDDTITEFDSPITVSQSGYTLATISSAVFDPLPKHPRVATTTLANSWWTDGSLTIATKLLRRYSLTLKIPSIEQAVWMTLAYGRSNVVLSDKGKLAEAVERSLGSDAITEPGSLDVIRILTTPRTRHLIEAISTWRAEGLDDSAIEVLALAATGRSERVFRSVSDIKGPHGSTGVDAAEALANSGYLERGLVVSCTACAITSFITLTDVRSAAICPACGTVQSFRASSGPIIHYRLHGLVDRASDQGALLHLQVRRQLLESSETGFLIPGALVGDAEVDLFGVVDGRVHAGELKLSPGGFTEEQLERDVRLSAELDADVHVMGSAEPLPESLLMVAQRIARHHEVDLRACDPNGVRFVAPPP